MKDGSTAFVDVRDVPRCVRRGTNLPSVFDFEGIRGAGMAVVRWRVGLRRWQGAHLLLVLVQVRRHHATYN